MKNKITTKRIFYVFTLYAISMLITFTNLFSNTFMLLTDRSNFIPAESSLLFFDPYIIDQGSSNNWIYGKDKKNYYYFSHDDDIPYIYVSKSNTCPYFDKNNYETWCSTVKGRPN